MSQPPLYGNFFNIEGKNAKRVNGSANAVENANIVIIGDHTSPEVDLISTEPTIGPVQEKDTSTKVRAIKKIPPIPPLSDCASLLFTRALGSVISKAPKNDAAKTINTTKKMRFGTQCVASQLKMSAVTLSPPNTRVIIISIAIGSV